MMPLEAETRQQAPRQTEKKIANPDSFQRQVGRAALDIFVEKLVSFFKTAPPKDVYKRGLYEISSYSAYQRFLSSKPRAEEVGLKPTSKTEAWETQKFSVLAAEIVVSTGTLIIVPLLDRHQAIVELKFEIYFEAQEGQCLSKLRTVNLGKIPDSGEVAKIVTAWDKIMNENMGGLKIPS